MPKSKSSHNNRIKNKIAVASRLSPFIHKHIKKLEDENERMKTDPDTALGQLIPQMREAITQNKRLSVLAAALIDQAGGAVTLDKTALESFETKVLSIKWELPEGVESADVAEKFIFKYEAMTPEQAQGTPSEPPVTFNEDEYLAAFEDAQNEVPTEVTT